ncbi:hypothetical protein FHU29_002558 [Hoyosella altamirensis]|uniref:Uncharacterized protein n=1 Tax=Hoyosella altamirensis TaxID=616997 RepID=A0A839RP76_9ACTN|nr:hypothetical protein [Hoyosella altamirensis]
MRGVALTPAAAAPRAAFAVPRVRCTIIRGHFVMVAGSERCPCELYSDVRSGAGGSAAELGKSGSWRGAR